MTRTLFHGGSVFDGTGADPRPADVTVEDGRIVDASVFLLENSAVNGVDLIVDGGWHCR